jgi:hypothetical protein
MGTVMPKETIKDEQNPVRAVEVGWQRDGTVQIGTTDQASPLTYPADSSMPGLPMSGFFAHLDRAGCNRLIRAVRRARDGAFGADA